MNWPLRVGMDLHTRQIYQPKTSKLYIRPFGAKQLPKTFLFSIFVSSATLADIKNLLSYFDSLGCKKHGAENPVVIDHTGVKHSLAQDYHFETLQTRRS